MNIHAIRPDLAADSIPPQLAAQQRRAEKTRQRVSQLRKRAFEEIERLIAFLDASDGYTMHEREVNGDEADASFPEGCRRCVSPMEDDEDGGDCEPSLAACEEHPDFDACGSQLHWAEGNSDEREGDDCADDREGDELQHGGDAEREDYEPSLGWTELEAAFGSYVEINGCCDLEAGGQARSPQNRTDLNTTLSMESGYRKSVHGLSDNQRTAVRNRMHDDSGVVLR